MTEISKELAEATEITRDEWRVHRIADYQRTLPRDIHEMLTGVEMDVARILGSKSRDYALGRSVEVLTVIVHFLNEHREELKQKAEEWV